MSSEEIKPLTKDEYTKCFTDKDFAILSDSQLVLYCNQLVDDNDGCVFLQKKLEKTSHLCKDMFYKLKDRLVELTTNITGNYLVQHILEGVTEKEVEMFLKMIANDFSSIANDKHGTRVIQALIDYLYDQSFLEFFNSLLEPVVFNLSTNENGFYVVQKYVSVISFPSNQFVFDCFMNNVLELGTNKHGCCVFQKCFENSKGKQLNRLLDKTIKFSSDLMKNSFGNYVIQFIINNYGPKEVDQVVLSFAPDILQLSKEKFSSNVIEKCFDKATDQVKMNLITMIANPFLIGELLVDQFGNYVVQKALKMASDELYKQLIYLVIPRLPELKTIGFGPKLFKKLCDSHPVMVEVIKNSTFSQLFEEFKEIPVEKKVKKPYKHKGKYKKK